jgi:hypothetical protein
MGRGLRRSETVFPKEGRLTVARTSEEAFPECCATTAGVPETTPAASGFWTGGCGPSMTTGAMNRYPRLASVSMNRGFSAESPRASRILLMALAIPCSKSMVVLSPQTSCCNCSRVTTSPGLDKSAASTLNGWTCSLTRRPAFRISPAPKSTSKVPKQTIARLEASIIDSKLPARLAYTVSLHGDLSGHHIHNNRLTW